MKKILIMKKILKGYCIFTCTHMLIEITPSLLFTPADENKLPTFVFYMYMAPLMSPFMLISRFNQFHAWLIYPKYPK